MFISINSISQSLPVQFDEIAIANFGNFQIVVPTTAQNGINIGPRGQQALNAATLVRRYSSGGWLICDRRVTARCQGLTLGELSTPSPFKPIRRIAPSIPLSFEALSEFPLAARAASQAIFCCQLSNSEFLTIFRQIVPRFVKVYPFEGRDAILEQTKQFLIEEAWFISENYARLRHILFYQQRFKL
ncbi:MAG: hypothetical protein ACFB4J_16595 [Elainellaceae cyanobacterium]